MKEQRIVDCRLGQLSEIIQTVEMKSTMMRTQMLAETYSSKTIPALMCIRTVLEKRLRAAKRRSAEAEAALRDLESCGDELIDLAQEQRTLADQISDKEQQLAYLRDGGQSLP